MENVYFIDSSMMSEFSTMRGMVRDSVLKIDNPYVLDVLNALEQELKNNKTVIAAIAENEVSYMKNPE